MVNFIFKNIVFIRIQIIYMINIIKKYYMNKKDILKIF